MQTQFSKVLLTFISRNAGGIGGRGGHIIFVADEGIHLFGT